MQPQEMPYPQDEPVTEARNEALWLTSPGGSFTAGLAPMPAPRRDELVVRVRAVAVNPADVIPGVLRRIICPWLRYPAVIGTDVAGEVVEVGPGVEGLKRGDRVLAYAAGLERSRNTAAEGAFQRYVVVLAAVCTPLPATVSFEQGAVVPLGAATAAAGLYEQDQLALPLPRLPRHPTPGVVLIWGGSSSVGCNAIQLASASGFDVIATASPKNHALLKQLGAGTVFDYHDERIDQQVVNAVGDRELVGVLAVGAGSVTHALRITRRTRGTKRISTVYPDPITRLRGLIARVRGARISVIWGGTPIQSPVGPAVFRTFLPDALQDGSFRPAPDPRVVGDGLEQLPAAFAALRAGVSASKIVVTVP